MKYRWLFLSILLILSGYLIPYTVLANTSFLPAIFWIVITLLIAFSIFLYTRGWGR